MNQAIDRFGDMADTWVAVTRLMADTQCVLTMRLLGLSGVWSLPEGESQAMVGEKVPVFTEAALSGTFAMMSGRSPHKVFRETLKPISSKASANRERLEDRGPLIFGRRVTRA